MWVDTEYPAFIGAWRSVYPIFTKENLGIEASGVVRTPRCWRCALLLNSQMNGALALQEVPDSETGHMLSEITDIMKSSRILSYATL